MRPRGESFSLPSCLYVGHEGRQSPQWTQVRSLSVDSSRSERSVLSVSVSCSTVAIASARSAASLKSRQRIARDSISIADQISPSVSALMQRLQVRHPSSLPRASPRGKPSRSTTRRPLQLLAYEGAGYHRSNLGLHRTPCE